jgi:hypothetical protein
MKIRPCVITVLVFLLSLVTPARPATLTSNAFLYVDGLNGNDSNPGTSSSPWATFAPAFNYLCYQNFGNGYAAEIFVSNASSISAAGGGGGNFYMNCDPQGFAFVILNLGGGTLVPAPGYDAITIANNQTKDGYGGGAFLVTNGTLTCSGGGAALHVTSGNAVIWSGGGALIMGSCPGGAHIFADGTPARVYVNGGYTIGGNAAYEWAATAGGGIDLGSPATITCNGSLLYSGAFASSSMVGWVYAPTGTISLNGCGSVTGLRYVASTNGVINTNGGGANFLPGSFAGRTTVGGQFN